MHICRVDRLPGSCVHVRREAGGRSFPADVSLDPPTGELGCPYVLMHMRGTPQTMQHKENTAYGVHAAGRRARILSTLGSLPPRLLCALTRL